ncbi:MAG: aspartyl protease family protein [Gammaproteobacteria bacterium]
MRTQMGGLLVVLGCLSGAPLGFSAEFNVPIPLEYREGFGYFMKMPVGNQTFDLLVDTGSTVGLIFPDPIAATLEEQGLIRESGYLARVTLAHGGSTKVEVFHATVSFGGCKVDDIDMIFTVNKRHRYGIVGYTLLERFAPFKIEVRPPRHMLYLTCKN